MVGGRGLHLRPLGEAPLPSLPAHGAPLSPQLMEIQADYHRKSLSSLDTALAELKENHSQAGGDVGGPSLPPLIPLCLGHVKKLALRSSLVAQWVKDPVLSLPWLWSLLWPGNFCMPQAHPGGKKKKSLPCILKRQ